MAKTEFLTPKQVAEFYGVTIVTVQRWIKKGKIKTVQPHGPRGRQFIRRTALDQDKLGG